MTPRRRLLQFRLRTRVVAAVGVPIIALASFFAVFVPTELEDAARAALKRHGLTTSRILARIVSPALSAGQIDEVRGLLAHTKADPSIRFAAVVGQDGRALARVGQVERAGGIPLVGTSPRRKAMSEMRGSLFTVTRPLLKVQDLPGNSEVMGTLVVAFAGESVTNVRQKAAKTALFVTLISLVLGGIIAWFFSGNIARPLLETSERLNRVSEDLVDAARARENALAREADAVEETRRTMDLLRATAQHIAETATDVLANAERTLGSSKEIAERIDQLNLHAEKVAEVLTGIMQVADRADLLALNAAVEGTKAGKGGKGFILVANEMRRLAENLMASVESIQRLLHDVRASAQEAVAASLSGTRSSEETTRSVRDIAQVTQRQGVATVQVSKSMEEMTELLNQAMSDIKYTNKSALALSSVAQGLAGLIDPATEDAPSGATDLA